MNTKPGGMFFANNAIAENQLPLFKEGLKPSGKVPVVNPEEIHIIVSGSIPGHSFGMPYLRSAHKTKLIQKERHGFHGKNQCNSWQGHYHWR